MIWYLLGVITGLIISEYLPSDTVNKIGKVKLKNSDSNELEFLTPKQEKRKPLLKRIFSRKQKRPIE